MAAAPGGRGGRARRVATFPSAMPVMRIDHAFISAGLRVVRLAAPVTPLTRLASDHLPLVIDVEVEDRAAPVLVEPARVPRPLHRLRRSPYPASRRRI